MILNCKDRDWQQRLDAGLEKRRRVFMDGREYPHTWYVDTDAGYIRTYDIRRDQREPAITTEDLTTDELAQAVAEGWDLPDRGPVSRTVYGSIRLEEIPASGE